MQPFSRSREKGLPRTQYRLPEKQMGGAKRSDPRRSDASRELAAFGAWAAKSFRDLRRSYNALPALAEIIFSLRRAEPSQQIPPDVHQWQTHRAGSSPIALVSGGCLVRDYLKIQRLQARLCVGR